MMGSKKCTECGTTENVKQASEYPQLAAQLTKWNAMGSSGGDYLCPQCAQVVSEELGTGTARICRLDPSGPGGQQGLH